MAKSVIVNNFQNSDSEYSALTDDSFVDSKLDFGTLSENMTIGKLSRIIRNIKNNNYNDYAGVIVLHGTDTLAYTAALFSAIFADSAVPVMLVSANRPLKDPDTNGNSNFRCAVELIMGGISPNVYVPYRNSDGVMYLHIASTIMQCQNFSENFYNASSTHVFTVDSDILKKCRKISRSRNPIPMPDKLDESSVMLISPYTGLDYSRIDLSGIRIIVHGTYHSGTVCVERSSTDECYGTRSILHLADRCREANIQVFIAPSALNECQYSSMFDAAKTGILVPLNMTSESAYAKAVIGIALSYDSTKLHEFMLTDIAGEIIE